MGEDKGAGNNSPPFVRRTFLAGAVESPGTLVTGAKTRGR